MTAAEALAALNTTLKANAGRPAATRPLADSSTCTNPRCTRCGGKR